MKTNESAALVKSGNQPLNAVYRCFDCGETFRGYAEDASWSGSCRACPIGMLLVVELNGEAKNSGYFPAEESPNA